MTRGSAGSRTGNWALADRMQALRVAEEQAIARIEELVQAEADLAATIAQVESAAETDLDRLVTVYENMRPADASALFATMAPEFAAGFIGRMRPEAASGTSSRVLTRQTPIPSA